jgi:MFS family permease
LPAGKWLGANVIAWGIATACTAAATNYTTLLVCRIFLGALEAAIAPSLMMISSQWYTNAEQASRFALWFCGAGLSQIIGSLIAFGFQHLSPTAPLAGWRIMFIVLGLLTIVTGIATYFMIPDSPMSAGFLSKAEKVALLNHISKNRTGVYQQKMDVSQLKELFFDVQLWLFTVLSLLVSCNIQT